MIFTVFGYCCNIFDTTSGIFIECVCGNIVKTRVGFAFTFGSCNYHKNDPNHLYKIALFIKRAKIIEEKLERGDKSSNLYNNWNKQTNKKKHTPMIFS